MSCLTAVRVKYMICWMRKEHIGITCFLFIAWACSAASGPGPREPAHAQPSDRDGDTVPDHRDYCPDDPEDLDGYKDKDGCPDCDHGVQWVMCTYDEAGGSCHGATADDHDGDGIANHQDTCPELTEDRDAFDDEDGCPEPDNDSDCLFDQSDKCPNTPGPESSGGCPPEAVIGGG